eukprot:TRINITY_DN21408_c0_g1_i1.p1 TRINITY_DN21408_c0_g1~~TRINITY_DN21408_c0_g1_i1.p1  ORF type:complete len:417 (+),score=95.17 TRINITY_DN21408_c0_g1_i1:43-1293(+)
MACLLQDSLPGSPCSSGEFTNEMTFEEFSTDGDGDRDDDLCVPEGLSWGKSSLSGLVDSKCLFKQKLRRHIVKEGHPEHTPKARFGHTAVVHRDSMIVYGGRDNRCFDDLWQLCLKTKVWREIKQSAQRPIPRAGHTAVVHKDKMYVFGGVADHAGVHNWWLNDLWVLNLETYEWSRIPSLGCLTPDRRKGHTAVVHNDKMYVFGGGQDDLNNPLLLFNDIWELDFETERWTACDYGGEIPEPRMYHTCVMGDAQNMVLFGGRAEGGFLNDVYELDLSRMRARLVRVKGTPPENRMCSTAIYHNKTLAIFTGGAFTYFEDSHQLNFETMTWGTVDSDIKFGGRTRPTTVKWKNTVVTFGGCVTGNGYVNDYVEIELEPLSLQQHLLHHLSSYDLRKDIPHLPPNIAALITATAPSC